MNKHYRSKIDQASIQLGAGKNRLHPVVEALLEERGYKTPEEQRNFLTPNYERDVQDPFLFAHMQDLITLFRQAKKESWKIGVFGDFDCDGVTSTVIFTEGLKKLGMPYEVYLPDKLTEGHGLSNRAVDFFEAAGTQMIVTLDCGMMNHEAIAYARSLGQEVVVIDHHHVPEVLPEASVIINPKLKTETYPFTELCGAGTSFKVVTALWQTFIPEEADQAKWLLDVAALGTVADVMPLIGENRALVQYGLLVLTKTRRNGLAALLALCRQEEGFVPTAEFIAFQVAPRINAASRMAHARIAYDLLMAEDDETAAKLAKELDALNTKRQKQSREVTAVVCETITQNHNEDAFLCVSNEAYPYGIVGLIAGRVANQYQKPAAILTNEGETSRGSLRSIPGFSVIQALEAVSDVLIKYGGHEQAAGMTIENKHLDLFRRKMNEFVAEWQGENGEDTSVVSDGVVDIELFPAQVTPELLRELKKMAPFGEGNREPVFLMRDALVADVRTLGADGQHLKLKVELGNKAVDAIGFSLSEAGGHLAPGQHATLIFTLGENVWRGRRSLQLQLVDVL